MTFYDLHVFRMVVNPGPFDFIEVSIVISGVKRYIRTILRFCKDEAEVRKQEFP